MLVIVALLALLSSAEASLKTPRTASPPRSSSSPSLPTTTLTGVVPTTTTTESGIYPQCNGSVSSELRPTNAATASIRCTALPIDQSTSIPTGTASTAPEITPSPEFDPPGGNFHEIGVKFVQTTYWSCVTFPLETHCGWHEPILDAGAGRAGCEGGQAALRAGILAGVVAGGLVLGM
ncbi:hypothetical protein F4677DRAFT_318486 [Hypoxylon crocopeplum]|nr:hypothetical protein F4677DRAFT_318486 [Hypoxylon crocopeplum]